MNVGVNITDATKENYPLVYVNLTLCTMTGHSADELIGHGVQILMKNDLQPLRLTKVVSRSLVVEDNDRVRELTVERLHASGYRTLQARNCPIALEIPKADAAFDPILTDIQSVLLVIGKPLQNSGQFLL